jgi:hypothetical protein
MFSQNTNRKNYLYANESTEKADYVHTFWIISKVLRLFEIGEIHAIKSFISRCSALNLLLYYFIIMLF